MQHAVIVLPTYNEKSNIGKLLEAIANQRRKITNAKISALVVDDSSPDGTDKVVKEYQQVDNNIHLLSRPKKQGLGRAYISGFAYAIHTLKADIVFEMDSDFSHNPNYIPLMLKEVMNGADIVIGSRYIPHGSIPQNWSLLRRANSKWGNIFARYVAGLHEVRDCTSGFRAIKTNVLKQINFEDLKVKGYAFQINLLHQLLQKNSRVLEIPIHFTDRVYGESKIRLSDITEFIINSFRIRFSL